MNAILGSGTTIVAANAVAFLGFLAALVMAFMLPEEKPGIAGRGVKALLASAAAVYLFVATSNMLEWGWIGPTILDEVEDYLRVLFVPLLVYTVHALRARQLYFDEVAAARLARQQHDFLLEVVDMSPVGLLVADGQGRITFASDAAKHALGVADETEDATLAHPAWKLSTAEGLPLESGFASLCKTGGPAEDVPLVLTWPDGGETSLLVSVSPMADGTGRIGGCVVALEDVEARRAAFGA